jgi:hypothetical protein
MREALAARFKATEGSGLWLCPCCQERLARVVVEKLQGLRAGLRLEDGWIYSQAQNAFVKPKHLKPRLRTAAGRKHRRYLEGKIAAAKQKHDHASILDASQQLEHGLTEPALPIGTKTHRDDLPLYFDCVCSRRICVPSVRGI